MNEWNNLSQQTREYINSRFSVYGIKGENAFNDKTLFPEELKNLDSKELIELLQSKDISHVMPKSIYPELEKDISNIVLEDSSINRVRGAEIMSEKEIETAQKDYFEDIEDFENNIEILDNIPEILAGSTAIGLGLSSYKAYNKVKNGEILLNETPRFIILNSGSKIIKAAIIGVCATSGTPILVTGAFAYTLYKAKGLISSTFKGVWNISSHPATVNFAKTTGVIATDIIVNTATVIGKTSLNIATSETTKNIAIGTVNVTGKVISKASVGIYNVATHETTKAIAKGAVSTTGKMIFKTTKGLFKIAKWTLKK